MVRHNRLGTISLGSLNGDLSAPSPRASILPDSRSAANQVTKTFPYQSYFDDTLLWRAISDQPLGQAIIQSTQEQQQMSGYAIGNHPDSQAPIAVTFSGEGRQSGSASHIIPPGAIVRPTKGIIGEDGFQSFSWGLPFGWLGGGTVTMVVFQTPDAWANWTPRSQILFHRFRAQILAPGNIPAAASVSQWPRNWPLRFPALNMRRGATSIPQGGAAQIAISAPGQVVFRLHTTVTSAAEMKAVYFHTTDFDDEMTVLPSPLPLDAVQFNVPGHTAYAYPAGYTEYTLFEGPAELSRIGCSGANTAPNMQIAGVHFVSDDPSLQGQYLDVARYGYL
jgi:hypothetical protein